MVGIVGDTLNLNKLDGFKKIFDNIIPDTSRSNDVGLMFLIAAIAFNNGIKYDFGSSGVNIQDQLLGLSGTFNWITEFVDVHTKNENVNIKKYKDNFIESLLYLLSDKCHNDIIKIPTDPKSENRTDSSIKNNTENTKQKCTNIFQDFFLIMEDINTLQIQEAKSEGNHSKTLLK